MIPGLLTWALLAAVFVIVFVAGLAIGRLQEQDAQRARTAGRLVPVQRLLRHDGPWRTCRTCGAAPGQPCTPQGIRRVPTPRAGA
jgi:hypothetical protein